MKTSISSSPVTSFSAKYGFTVPVGFYDCEVNEINPATTEITEMAVCEGEASRVRYVRKPEHVKGGRAFQKKIPEGKKRRSFQTSAQKIMEFVDARKAKDAKMIMIGYNVLGWDEPVLQNHFRKYNLNGSPLSESLSQWKFFDLSIVAQNLKSQDISSSSSDSSAAQGGYPRGTTQEELAQSLNLDHLPANRHRALADVKVAKKIFEKILQNLSKEQLERVDQCFLEENAEEKLDIGAGCFQWAEGLLTA